MASSSLSPARHVEASERATNSSTEGLSAASPSASQEAPPQSEPAHGSTVTLGQPTGQLRVEEPVEDEIDYPTGPQLWLNTVSFLLVCFLHGLDCWFVNPYDPTRLI